MNSQKTAMELLAEIKVSQSQVARLAGVSVQTVHRWVHGHSKPTLVVWEFVELSRKLGVTPEVLAEAFHASFEAAQLKSAHGETASA